MKEIIQLYTEAFASNFINSRRIIFLAEGYRTSDESIFYQDVSIFSFGVFLFFAKLKKNVKTSKDNLYLLSYNI